MSSKRVNLILISLLVCWTSAPGMAYGDHLFSIEPKCTPTYESEKVVPLPINNTPLRSYFTALGDCFQSGIDLIDQYFDKMHSSRDEEAKLVEHLKGSTSSLIESRQNHRSNTFPAIKALLLTSQAQLAVQNAQPDPSLAIGQVEPPCQIGTPDGFFGKWKSKIVGLWNSTQASARYLVSSDPMPPPPPSGPPNFQVRFFTSQDEQEVERYLSHASGLEGEMLHVDVCTSFGSTCNSRESLTVTGKKYVCCANRCSTEIQVVRTVKGERTKYWLPINQLASAIAQQQGAIVRLSPIQIFQPAHLHDSSLDPSTINHVDGEGKAILHHYIESGNFTGAHILIENGAAPLKDENGDTPLHRAAAMVDGYRTLSIEDAGNIPRVFSRELDLINHLIRAQTQIATPNKIGVTPISLLLAHSESIRLNIQRLNKKHNTTIPYQNELLNPILEEAIRNEDFDTILQLWNADNNLQGFHNEAILKNNLSHLAARMLKTPSSQTASTREAITAYLLSASKEELISKNTRGLTPLDIIGEEEVKRLFLIALHQPSTTFMRAVANQRSDLLDSFMEEPDLSKEVVTLLNSKIDKIGNSATHITAKSLRHFPPEGTPSTKAMLETQLLGTNKKDLIRKNKKDQTPLDLLGVDETKRLFLEALHNNRPKFIRAVANQRPELLNLAILEENLDPALEQLVLSKQKSKNKNSELHISAIKRKLTILKQAGQANFKKLLEKNSDGKTPLHLLPEADLMSLLEFGMSAGNDGIVKAILEVKPWWLRRALKMKTYHPATHKFLQKLKDESVGILSTLSRITEKNKGDDELSDVLTSVQSVLDGGSEVAFDAIPLVQRAKSYYLKLANSYTITRIPKIIGNGKGLGELNHDAQELQKKVQSLKGEVDKIQQSVIELADYFIGYDKLQLPEGPKPQAPTEPKSVLEKLWHANQALNKKEMGISIFTHTEQALERVGTQLVLVKQLFAMQREEVQNYLAAKNQGNRKEMLLIALRLKNTKNTTIKCISNLKDAIIHLGNVGTAAESFLGV